MYQIKISPSHHQKWLLFIFMIALFKLTTTECCRCLAFIFLFFRWFLSLGWDWNTEFYFIFVFYHLLWFCLLAKKNKKNSNSSMPFALNSVSSQIRPPKIDNFCERRIENRFYFTIANSWFSHFGRLDTLITLSLRQRQIKWWEKRVNDIVHVRLKVIRLREREENILQD